MKEALVELYKRDILKLNIELEAYKNASNIWMVQEGISNSAGNLCLHLVGNLNYFIGNILGQTGYVRNRDNEFAEKNVPMATLVQMINDTIEVTVNTISKMQEDDFEKIFPVKYNGQDTRTDQMLLHLLTHLNYHLGQINYHRRLLDK